MNRNETPVGDCSASTNALRAENIRLNKVVRALMNRAERSTSVRGSEYAMFQTAVMLEAQVQNRTRELKTASQENERINRALEVARADIARALDAERNLRILQERADRRYRLLFENARIGIFIIDRDGRLQSWNPELARMLDLPDDAAGRTLGEIFDDVEGLAAEFGLRVRVSAEAVSADLQCRGRDGTPRWINLVLNPIDEFGVQGIANDITELKVAESVARAQAERDPLTELLNRRGLERLITSSGSGWRAGQGRAVLLVDLDGFKTVNDGYGHDAGDTVLQSVARQLEACVRQGDIVARVGGDEFVVVLEGVASSDVATRIAGNVVLAVQEPIFLASDEVVRIGASVGVAVASDLNEPFDSLLARADQAMYRAKSAGKSQYRCAEPIQESTLGSSGLQYGGSPPISLHQRPKAGLPGRH